MMWMPACWKITVTVVMGQAEFDINLRCMHNCYWCVFITVWCYAMPCFQHFWYLDIHVLQQSQAYKQGYTYPRYLFFTISWYSERWWFNDIEKYGCTGQQMEEVLQYSMTLLILPYARYRDRSLRTDTGGGLVRQSSFYFPVCIGRCMCSNM